MSNIDIEPQIRPDTLPQSSVHSENHHGKRPRLRRIAAQAIIFVVGFEAARQGAIQTVEAYELQTPSGIHETIAGQIGGWPPRSPMVEDGIPERIDDARHAAQIALGKGSGVLVAGGLLVLGVGANIYRKNREKNSNDSK